MNLRGEKIVVTGGTGFLGQHVSAVLRDVGADVLAVGRADFDLRHRAEADRLLSTHRPAMVVHLAVVEGGLGATSAEPGRMFYENALMGIELLDACRVAGVDKTLIVGTVSSYPSATPVPFLEEEFWAGYPDESNAAYGLARKMLLVQANAYRHQYGMNIIYLIPANIYGPHDNFNLTTSGVVPALIRKFIQARDSGDDEVVLWGDGTPTREFLYVEDAAVAFRLAMERYDQPEPMNIGSGHEISIRDLAALVQRLVGFTGTVRWDVSRPNGQPRRKLYTSRASRYLGFEPSTTLEDGLIKTIQWYMDHVGAGVRPAGED